MTEDREQENLKAFLEDLTELTRKHRLAIGGCGCCGSPWIHQIEDQDLAGAYASYGGLDLTWEGKG